MQWLGEPGFGLSFFVTLFSVLNPAHAVPLYLSIVTNPTDEMTRHVASTAATTVLVILLLALFAGEPLLDFFGITLPAFQVAGGLLILLMGLSMLQGQVSPAKSTPEETEEAQQWRSIAIVPLGIPILAGAGAMSTVIVFDHQAKDWVQWGSLVVGIIVNAGICWVFLRYSHRLIGVLGQTGVNVIGRLTGIVLVAMAVQFMANGLYGLFPILARDA
jgi:multiple antibiotic resistance protein